MAEATTQTQPVINTGRIKYADPRSLPSFPSSGLRPDGAAAGAAATLGWNNQKPIELWKPDKASSASAAAVLAKDYKMAPQWEPSQSSAGHKAAMLAVGSANAALKHQSDAPVPRGPHDGWGNSAATQAFHADRPTVQHDTKDLSHGGSAATQAFNANRTQSLRVAKEPAPVVAPGDRSLLAAQGAMSSNLQRSHSTASASREIEARRNSSFTANALNGATKAHRASLIAKPPSNDAGAVPVTTMTRNMFTSHPMVKPEVDERANNERLHQSAVEMAKKMYSAQQRMVDQAKDHDGEPGKANPPAILNLQDAAYKQAQERLAKLHDEHAKNREYQEYYGSAQAPRRRFTVTNKLRRRNSDTRRRGDSDDEFDDQFESQRIRQQMSMFSTKLSEVDKNKRQQDRDALMAAAQRNVKARLHGMDEKVYNDTGKVNPALLSEWEVKAQQTAQSRSETRNVNQGKVDLGGGMFMDSNDVDAIATKRMQPILDDINSKAEAERERVAALKLADEARKEEAEKQKSRDREMKELSKRIREEEKQDQKAKRQQEKDEERARKDAEGGGRRFGTLRRSKHDSAKSGLGEEIPVEHHTAAENAEEEERVPSETGSRQNVAASGAVPVGGAVPATETVVSADPDHVYVPDRELDERPTSSADRESPTSPQSKVKGWIRNRFSRGKSVGEQDAPAEKDKKRRSLFGGNKKTRQNGTITPLEHRTSSMRDVAMAGRDGDAETHDHESAPQRTSGARDSRGVSPVSSVEDRRSERGLDDEDEEDGIRPPRPLTDDAPRSSISPNRGTRFREEMGA